jgi:competence protein ComEA
MLSRLMTVREQWILLGVAGAIVLGAGVLIWRGNTQSTPDGDSFIPQSDVALEVVPNAPKPLPSPTPPATAIVPRPPERIAVGILGAVKEEGLYYFETNARIRDLLAAAGGTLPESDLSDINRTALLLDETTLLVPEFIVDGNQTYSYPNPTYNPTPYTRSTWYRFKKDAPASNAASAPASSSATSSALGGLININTASQIQLETLPGIGPVTAKKIIAHRESQPFSAPGDLENVSGIGPAKMAAVRDLITVRR